MQAIEAVNWAPLGDAVRIIDQRLLPGEYVERDLRSAEEVVDAIRTLAVRGAPAIGICGAMGLAVAMTPFVDEGADRFQARLRAVATSIREARPTAVNLSWAIDRLMRCAAPDDTNNRLILDALRTEASAVLAEDRAMCECIGQHGLALVADGARVLTHCNAGALATGGIGTALAPIYAASRLGRRVSVIADETRPLLQGSRLTAWELARAGVDVTVIADCMAATLMREGAIDLCLVGADRIAANGDVANKIGTYGVAVLARHHGIPFYVAAPTSTIDPATPRGADIVIEERPGTEIAGPYGMATAPNEVRVRNPAFDVTPAELVTAIVTDRGVFRAPYEFRGSGRFGGPPQ